MFYGIKKPYEHSPNIKGVFKNCNSVAHTCNPSYPGGSEQEDLGLKPVRANSS
jgi:hypothetical protein